MKNLCYFADLLQANIDLKCGMDSAEEFSRENTRGSEHLSEDVKV
jgi:hypothetical protein